MQKKMETTVPKGSCRHVGRLRAENGFPYNYSRVQVYTVEIATGLFCPEGREEKMNAAIFLGFMAFRLKLSRVYVVGSRQAWFTGRFCELFGHCC